MVNGIMQRVGIILLGPPGAGKGTQARRMAACYNFARISTGDMLREAVNNGSALGKKAQSCIEAGNLVPDELVDAIVKSRLARRDCKRGFILDGYPRTIHQAEYLEKLFAHKDVDFLAIGIKVSDDLLLKRLAGRWTCSRCGKIFNAASNPSRDADRCDECNTLLVHRKDDSDQVVAERLHVYHEATEPLIQYYKNRGCYHEVVGERRLDEVYDNLKEIVDGRIQAREAANC